MSLGNLLREKREGLRLTLDEVARRTDYSKPYLSTVETGKVRNPPSDDLLAKLEAVLGFDSGLLLRIAHLERMPADIRKAFEDAQAENQQWRALAQKAVQEGGDLRELLASSDYNHLLEAPMENTESAPIAGKLIPVINKVPTGYPAGFDDLGYPPGAADDYVRCPDLHDAHAFAVRVVGDLMEPKYREGDIVIFSPARQVETATTALYA